MLEGDILTHISNVLKSINTNKFVAGIIALTLNMLSKYVTIDLSKTQQAYLKNSIFRQILIFSIVWVSTRDIIVSLILTGTFIALTQHLFNEDSPLCILPKNLQELESAIDLNDDNILTTKEIDHAINILNKAKKRQQKNEVQQIFESFKTRKF